MTPPVFAVDTAPGPELDLDSPSTAVSGRRRWRGPLAIAVAVLLIGAGVGAAVRTVTAGAPPPTLPQVELGFVEAHLDGETIATLQVTIHNSTSVPVTAARFEADGILSGRVTEPLDRIVPGPGTTAVLVPVQVECNRSLILTPLRAQVRLADGTAVPAVPQRELASAGGLCRQVRAALPDGWWDLWPGVTVRQVGNNLELTMPPLDPGASLAGVWAGTTILSYVTPPQPVGNRYKPITIKPPTVCVQDDPPRMPTGLRILLTGDGGLRNRYVVVGPQLARWLLLRC